MQQAFGAASRRSYPSHTAAHRNEYHTPGLHAVDGPAHSTSTDVIEPRVRRSGGTFTELQPGTELEPEADFFEVGGSSLLAGKLVAVVRKR